MKRAGAPTALARETSSSATGPGRSAAEGGAIMAEKSKGKDKGKVKKPPKARKRGLRPHEQRQQEEAIKKSS